MCMYTTVHVYAHFPLKLSHEEKTKELDIIFPCRIRDFVNGDLTFFHLMKRRFLYNLLIFIYLQYKYYFKIRPYIIIW